MQEIEQYFYKYTVTHCAEIDGDYHLKTTTGLTFGKTFNEVCSKLTDHFGEDEIEDMKIEFAGDCDVLEKYEIDELFYEIKTGLSEAIEYERGNIDLKTTILSTDDKANTGNNEENK